MALLDRPDQPSLGMGECAIGPTAAAIGNAVAHALGARLRELPLTRERVAAALAHSGGRADKRSAIRHRNGGG